MSLKRIGRDDIETFTIQTNPLRTYSSSSFLGVTGSIQLFARASDYEKEVRPLSAFSDSKFNDVDVQQLLDDVIESAKTQTNISNGVIAYMSASHMQTVSARKQKQLDVIRFVPSVLFTTDTQRKNVIKNVLYRHYRMMNSVTHWAYTNYHTLNFFTASSVPSNSVILYPNSGSTPTSMGLSGSYVLGDKFTFDFYINPRYTTDGPNDKYNAGTILHLSSCYAISIVSGTSKDITNRPDGFRLLLQVNSGTNVSPSLVTASTPLAFFSNDNSLRLNRWHHCAIRWSANANEKTGSFIIDNEVAGTFVIPSSSIAVTPQPGTGNPDVLCVGNYYQGNNAGSNAQALFFTNNVAEREGLAQIVNAGDSTTFEPTNYSFNHPLNAEIHELKIYDDYRTLDQIEQTSINGPKTLDNLLLYVPPFFVKESPYRKPYGVDADGNIIGGVMQTPFFAISGTTEDPFNVALSFGVDGHLLNVENFVRDFVTNNYPRLLNLTASEIAATTETLTANQHLYASGSVRKRNLTILPNDNGLFCPNFALLVSGTIVRMPGSSSQMSKFVNDLGLLDLSFITLNDLVLTSSIIDYTHESGSFFVSFAGATPEDPGVDPGSVLTILQRTRDTSSNEVTFFDISNMFYGNKIKPKSFSVVDSNISGSNNKISIKLSDDGHGNVYRSNALTEHAKWASVGNIFYDEGIVSVKTPNIPFYGKDQYEMSFQGEQNIHVFKVNALALPGEINSSSNPTYVEVSASGLAHETDERFVYINGVNLHDENLNVVMKTRFAQPIIKRNSDRYLIKIKLDF